MHKVISTLSWMWPLSDILTLQEIRQYAFPRVKDMHVDDRVGEIRHVRKHSDQSIVLANANVFETSWYMRGFEQAFEDMLLQPDLIHFIMDPQHLKENFGKDLCFEGGMCVQKVLPFRTVEEVREECRMLISILGKNGGYLCGPSHFIQAGTPAENIAAYFDEAQGFYTFHS